MSLDSPYRVTSSVAQALPVNPRRPKTCELSRRMDHRLPLSNIAFVAVPPSCTIDNRDGRPVRMGNVAEGTHALDRAGWTSVRL